jgi:hypothetical protein
VGPTPGQAAASSAAALCLPAITQGRAVLATLLDGLEKDPPQAAPVNDGGRAQNADAGIAK